MKVAVIGLDSAPPQLVFERWRKDLPNLDRIMREGCYGKLLSTNPPITVPAWACMVSSRDPGEQGIYGFRNRKDYSYDGYALVTAATLRHDMAWDLLGRAGRQVIVLGVPPSYPPKAVNGVQVGCFLTPSTTGRYTHPPEIREEIAKVTEKYVVDVEGFRTDDKAALLGRIHDKTRKHFAVARHLVTTHPWDFFMMVEMGVDRIQHAFWKFMDPSHPKYEAGNPFEGAMLEYYRMVDQEVGELVSKMPSDTAVLIVSDHGAKSLEGGICFNEWLIRNGFLTLKSKPATSTPIAKAEIDWSKTKAWGDGGYYGRLFMNVRGREPQGTVDKADYEKVRDEIVAGIREIADPKGVRIGSTAFRPEEIYRACNGVPPDLLVYFGDLRWRSIGSVGMGGIHTFENDTGPDDANHDWHGIFAMRIPGDSKAPKGELQGLRIYDVAPTILRLLGVGAPPEMLGRSIL